MHWISIISRVVGSSQTFVSSCKGRNITVHKIKRKNLPRNWFHGLWTLVCTRCCFTKPMRKRKLTSMEKSLFTCVLWSWCITYVIDRFDFVFSCVPNSFEAASWCVKRVLFSLLYAFRGIYSDEILLRSVQLMPVLYLLYCLNMTVRVVLGSNTGWLWIFFLSTYTFFRASKRNMTRDLLKIDNIPRFSRRLAPRSTYKR